MSRRSRSISASAPPARGAYLAFIRRAAHLFEELGNIDVVFADNRKATVPALRIKKKHPGVRIIQDARELYLRSEMTSFTSRVGCIFEEKLYKKADVIIAANDYRARRMQQEYALQEKPLVYENLRRLTYSPDADPAQLAQRFGDLLTGDGWRIISTSGCSLQRTNDKLVEAMAKVQAALHAVSRGRQHRTGEGSNRGAHPRKRSALRPHPGPAGPERAEVFDRPLPYWHRELRPV